MAPKAAVDAEDDGGLTELWAAEQWADGGCPEAAGVSPAPEAEPEDDTDDESPDEPLPAWAAPSRPRAGARPSASSVVAELWAEREQQGSHLGPPGGPGITPPVAGPPPRSEGGGKRGLIAAVVAVGVLLGGGVGVFLATSGVGLPSKTKFLARADGICAHANTSLATLAKPTNYPELATAVGSVVTATDAQVGELQKVKLPGGSGSDQARDVVSALMSTGVAVHALQTAAVAKDDAATARATTQVSTAFTDASAKATTYGFAACATGMQASMDNLIGGTKALIKTGFVARADNLCREASRKMDAIPVPKKDNRELARSFTEIVSYMTKLMSDLKALPVTPGDETQVAEMFAAQDKAVAKFVELRDALSANDAQRYNAAGAEFSLLTTAADAKFDAYGLAVCGSNF